MSKGNRGRKAAAVAAITAAEFAAETAAFRNAEDSHRESFRRDAAGRSRAFVAGLLPRLSALKPVTPSEWDAEWRPTLEAQGLDASTVSSTYRRLVVFASHGFLAMGEDVIIIRLNGKTVLEAACLDDMRLVPLGRDRKTGEWVVSAPEGGETGAERKRGARMGIKRGVARSSEKMTNHLLRVRDAAEELAPDKGRDAFLTAAVDAAVRTGLNRPVNENDSEWSRFLANLAKIEDSNMRAAVVAAVGEVLKEHSAAAKDKARDK
ncbi:MAG: hypothetical protein QW318_09500 [Candidatus Caldarchaeum sp.]